MNSLRDSLLCLVIGVIIGFSSCLWYSRDKGVAKSNIKLIENVKKIDGVGYGLHEQIKAFNDDTITRLSSGDLRLLVRSSDTATSAGVDNGSAARCTIHPTTAQNAARVTKRADEDATRLRAAQALLKEFEEYIGKHCPVK